MTEPIMSLEQVVHIREMDKARPSAGIRLGLKAAAEEISAIAALCHTVEELAKVLREVAENPNGCWCSPPLSGEEHCTCHCVARALLAQLDRKE